MDNLFLDLLFNHNHGRLTTTDLFIEKKFFFIYSIWVTIRNCDSMFVCLFTSAMCLSGLPALTLFSLLEHNIKKNQYQLTK